MKTLELNPPLEVNGAKPTPEKNRTGIQMHLQTLCYQTRERLELINISKDLNEVIRKNGMKAGLILVQSLHTTTAVFINEFQAGPARRYQIFPGAPGRADGLLAPQ